MLDTNVRACVTSCSSECVRHLFFRIGIRCEKDSRIQRTRETPNERGRSAEEVQVSPLFRSRSCVSPLSRLRLPRKSGLATVDSASQRVATPQKGGAHDAKEGLSDLSSTYRLAVEVPDDSVGAIWIDLQSHCSSVKKLQG